MDSLTLSREDVPRPAPARAAHPRAIDAGEKDLQKQVQEAFGAIESANAERIEVVRANGFLCRLQRTESGRLVAEELTEPGLMLHLAQNARWYSRTAKGHEKPAYPPKECIRAMLAVADPPVPCVRRLVTVPLVASNGHLIQEPGLYGPDGIWYEPDLHVDEVPDRPSPDEIEAAKSLLLDDLLGDFPFDSEASRACALALLLLPLVRLTIDGPTPLYVVDATSGPGTGKSLLVDVITLVISGLVAPGMTEAGNEDEWRKRITSELLRSPQFLRLDNLTRALRSGALSSAITTRLWADRLLGLNRTVEIPVDCAWVATGNGVRASADMARRIVQITLDAKTPSPHTRSNFRHPNLIAWITENRPSLLRASLVLVSNWIAQGRPRGTRSLGSFESWSAVMGGVLLAAGIPGFLDNLDGMTDATDDETREWQGFVGLWWERYAGKVVETTELFGLALDSDLLGGVLGDRGERSQKTRLGKALARLNGRYFSIPTLAPRCARLTIPETNSRKGTNCYQLVAAEEVGR